MNVAHLVLAAVLFVAAAPADVFAQNRRPPANLKSIEVDGERRVTFRIHAPKATEVTVAGDFGSGKLQKDEQGTWSVTVGPLAADFYTYSFNIDGVKTVDARNPLFKPGIAGLDSMFEVPGPEADFESTQDVPHGEIRAVWFASRVLGQQRRMHIYTPPGYEGGKQNYPVLYLLHGSGDDDTGWMTIGRAGFILDNLIAAGTARPMLVVMPNGSLPLPEGVRRFEADGKTLTPEWRAAADANQAKIALHIAGEIVPFVEETYRVDSGAERRALAGLSMGGGQTTRVLTTTPREFAYYGIWSSSVGKDGGSEWESANGDFLSQADRHNASIRLLSISVGDRDEGALAGSRALSDVLTRRGVKHELHITGGAHTWINWRKYLNEFVPRLFQ